jgi:hypothetical protein
VRALGADVKLLCNEKSIKASFTKEHINEMASIIAEKVAEELYYELLFERYLPEIQAVEKGKLKAYKNKDAEKYMKRLIARR